MADTSQDAQFINSQDIQRRIDELQEQFGDAPGDWTEDDQEELDQLQAFAAAVLNAFGYGRNVVLVHGDYFEDYAKEYATEAGFVQHETAWPANHIDWTAAVAEFRKDYSEVDYAGVPFFGRS